MMRMTGGRIRSANRDVGSLSARAAEFLNWLVDLVEVAHETCVHSSSVVAKDLAVSVGRMFGPTRTGAVSVTFFDTAFAGWWPRALKVVNTRSGEPSKSRFS